MLNYKITSQNKQVSPHSWVTQFEVTLPDKTVAVYEILRPAVLSEKKLVRLIEINVLRIEEKINNPDDHTVPLIKEDVENYLKTEGVLKEDETIETLKIALAEKETP